MKAKKMLLAIAIFSMVALTAVGMSVTEARPGGMTVTNYAISSCGCHDVLSSGSVTISVSNQAPAPSEQITVTVTVTGGQQTAGQPMGVLLNTGSGTTPSSAGWTIVSDPAGTAFDFAQIPWSSPHTFTWTMKAPATAGTFVLDAYMIHGGGSTYYRSASTSVAVTGAGPGPGPTPTPEPTPTPTSSSNTYMWIGIIVAGAAILTIAIFALALRAGR